MANCAICGDTIVSQKYVRFIQPSGVRFICLKHDPDDVRGVLANEGTKAICNPFGKPIMRAQGTTPEKAVELYAAAKYVVD